jgi:hypothetical protein
MKDKRCFLCKYAGVHEMGTAENVLYGKKGKFHHINLCYNHGVELFKIGQINFTVKYSHHFQGRYGVNEDEEVVNLFTRKSKDVFDF